MVNGVISTEQLQQMVVLQQMIIDILAGMTPPQQPLLPFQTQIAQPQTVNSVPDQLPASLCQSLISMISQQPQLIPNQIMPALPFSMTPTPIPIAQPSTSETPTPVDPESRADNSATEDDDDEQCLVIDEEEDAPPKLTQVQEASESRDDSGLGMDSANNSGLVVETSGSAPTIFNSLLVNQFDSTLFSQHLMSQQLMSRPTPSSLNKQQFLAGLKKNSNVTTTMEPKPVHEVINSNGGRKRKSDEDGKFECPICHKKFSRQWYVNGAHYRMHMGEKPFQCSLCDKTFNDRSNCRAHERVCSHKYQRSPAPSVTPPIKIEDLPRGDQEATETPVENAPKLEGSEESP